MKSMGLVIFLAWRNVLRYRRRTVQTFLILFCGALCIMVVDAYMRGFAGNAMGRIVSQSGHLDVHARGYLDSAEAMPLDLAVPDAVALMDSMLASAQGAAGGASGDASGGAAADALRPMVAASVTSGCMLSDGERSRGALVLAAEPFARSLPGSPPAANPLLSGAGGSIGAGRFYRDAADAGAILDAKYARALGLSPGDALILLGGDAYGSFSMMETEVIGIAAEGSLPGGAGCVVDLASFGPAFGLEDKAGAVSLWMVSGESGTPVADGSEAPAVEAVLAALAGDPELEARPFRDISAGYATMFEFLDGFMLGMVAVFALVASVGMANAILLSVQQRIKDLGTLRAIALSSRQAGFLIYAETAITGAMAALAALAVGALTVRLMVSAGFSISAEMSEMGSSLPDSIAPVFLPARLLAIAAMSAAFPLIAAMLPARMARRLTVRESLAG